MKRFDMQENVVDIEEKVISNLNLLELAKAYCELNYDKSDELLVISTVIDIVLKNQKELIKKIDLISI